MAFNKSNNEPVINSGFITSSRGLDTNNAYGDLFKGVGQTANNFLQSRDQGIRTDIATSANTLVDDTVNESMPPAVAEGIEGIKTLGTAKRQGMSEVDFQTRLVQKVKALKSTVPKGYWDIVDAAVSSASGASSANDLRRARLNEIEKADREANSAASEEEKQKNVYYGQNEKYLMDPQGQDLYKRKFGKSFDLGTATLREMQWVAGTMQGVEGQRTRMAAEDVANEKDAMNKASSWVVDETNKMMSQANPLFLKFQQQMDTLSKDGDISTEDRQTLLPLWTNFKQDITRRIGASVAGADNEFLKRMSAQQRADVMSSLKQRLDSFEEIFNDPTATALKMVQDDISLQKSVAENQLLKDDQISRYSAAVRLGFDRNQLDSVLGGMSTPSGDTWSNELNKRIANRIILGTITGDLTLGEGLDKADSKESRKAAIDNSIKLIIDPKTTTEMVAQMAPHIFNDKFDDVLEKYAAAGNRVALFSKLADPRVSEKILQGDGAKNYIDWANKQMRIIGGEASDVLIDSQVSSEIAAITFDGKQFRIDENQLAALVNGPMSLQLGIAQWEQYKAFNARKAVYDMNTYLRLMDPIWKKEYGDNYDVTAAVGAIMAGTDINKVAKQGNLLGYMLDNIMSYIGGDEGPAGKKTMDKAKENLPPSGDNMRPTEEQQGSNSITGRSLVNYANQGATRNLNLTNELEGKIATAVSTVLGDGYTAQVFSGGQPKKGTSKRRTGSIRHDEGKAADVYIIGPDGKRVTDTKTLDKLKEYWLKNDIGSVGTYMRGAGMHLDEWTKEELLAGMAQTWKY